MTHDRQQTIKLFTVAQLGIVLLLSLVIVFSLYRNIKVSELLENLTLTSIPQLTRASTLTNQIQQLANQTILLSNTHSNAGRELTKQRIDRILSRLNQNLNEDALEVSYFSDQIMAITSEFDELNGLVELRISRELQLQQSFDAIYADISAVLTRNNLTTQLNQEVTESLMQILSLTTQIQKGQSLNHLRQLEIQLNQELEYSIAKVTQQQQAEYSLFAQLGTQLTGENGLINQKIDLLRLQGRTRGRQNFVNNLITDIASNLQYQAQLVNQSTIESANSASSQAREQIKIIALAGVLALLFTLLIIALLYRRIISRLVRLAEQVVSITQDQQTSIDVRGNDEIGILASTFSGYMDKVQEQEKALLDMSRTDPLTGIPNRRAFDAKFEESISIARRHQWNITVMLIDVDFFKNYNDYYGHSDGDACLRLVANRLNQIVVRGTDFCARFGGEEFIFILNDTDIAGAKHKAEEIRTSIELLGIEHKGSQLEHKVITASIGVATFPFTHDANWQSSVIIEQADKALYQAKADGRNCCRYFTLASTING